MSNFIECIRKEDSSAMTNARQTLLRKDAFVRKKRYFQNDVQILHIINTYTRLETNKDLLIFLKRINIHLQEFVKNLPKTIPRSDDFDNNIVQNIQPPTIVNLENDENENIFD